MKYPRYFKVCPRGFLNEVTYIRIDTPEQAAAIEQEYADFEDTNPSGYSTWTHDRRAHQPGVAVSFADRDRG